MPSSEVYFVMQDSKGFVWFCTDAGISRFDGYSFKNFTSDDGLPDNTIFELMEDHKKRLWGRTLSGKVFYIEKDSIRSFDPGYGNVSVSSFYIDNKDKLTLGVYNKKGYITSTPPYSSHQYVEPKGNYYIIDNESDHCVFGYCNKNETIDDMSLLISGKSKTTLLKPGIGFVTFDTYKCIKKREGSFFIGVENTLLKVENGMIKEKIQLDHQIIHLSFDKNNGLWIGTKGGGAFHYPNADLLSNFIPEHYFAGDNISCILTDNENAIWASSTNNGVYYLPEKRISILNEKEGLPQNQLIGMDILNDTSFIVVSKNAYFSIISNKGRVIKNFTLKEIKYATYIKTISPSKVLVNSDKSYLLDLSNLNCHEIKSSNGKSLYTRKAIGFSNSLIISTYSGITKINLENGKIINIPVNFRINSFAKLNNDTIYMGCTDGLRYLCDTSVFFSSGANTLLGKRIEDMFTKNNTLYIATKGSGLLMKNGNEIRQISKSDGISSNICRSVCVDKQGEIWLVTNSGISRIVSRDSKNEIENINNTKGLLTYEIKKVTEAGENIFVISNQGLLIINKQQEIQNNYIVPVYITRTYLNNELINAEKNYFTYDQNYFSFEYVALSYKKGAKQLYRYKLEGLGTKYKYTTQTSVQYPALPPGDYNFVVTVVDDHFKPIGKTASFSLHIKKPFWKQTWFLVTVVLSIFLIVALLVQWRIRTIRKQEEEKNTFKTLITESELKALRAQMNPHFIFNTINSIQNFILKNDKTQAYDYLSRFSQLIRNVLEFSKSEGISLTEEIATLELYMQLEALRFDKQFEYKIEIDPSLNPTTIQIPSLLIQPYVENAIWHGIMHKEQKGHIIIKLSLADEHLLRCVIDDDGIGRIRSAQLKAKNILKRKSIGMEVTAQRMELFGKNMGSDTKAEIEDKYDEKGNAAGTRIILLIPILKK